LGGGKNGRVGVLLTSRCSALRRCGRDAPSPAHIAALQLFKLSTLCRSLAFWIVHRVSDVQIDVEGYEWAPLLQVFKDLSEGKMSVGQMQVELHSMLDVSISPSLPSPPLPPPPHRASTRSRS
jgi:hypothetical protein